VTVVKNREQTKKREDLERKHGNESVSKSRCARNRLFIDVCCVTVETKKERKKEREKYTFRMR
jgi:hypothetical protein